MKKQPSIWFALFLLVCLALPVLLAACGDSTATGAAAPSSGAPAATTAASGPSDAGKTTGSGSEGGAVAPTAAAPVNINPGTMTTAAAATTASASNAAAATTASVGGAAAASGTTAASSADRNRPAPTAGAIATQPPVVDQNPLQAGAVDDNLKFEEYLQYLRNYRDKPTLPFDVSERYIINVVDGNARSVANAQVKVFANQKLVFEGRTYSNGHVLFFPRSVAATAQVSQFDVTVEKDGRSANRTFPRTEPGRTQSLAGGATWMLDLTGSMRAAIEPSPNLDLLFLIDSTGSMGGEIRKIQQTINDIAYQISSLPGSPKVRYGVVTYRDRGDAYVTRKFGFTNSLTEFSSFLNSISAGGGGDIPESLNEALHVAVNDMNWATNDTVRLAFLVADAPPHLDYQQDYKYTDEAVNAVRKGIKIYAIGASGLDRQGEYVFRQLAHLTLAQYLFVTRGGDEAQPGSGGAARNTGTVYEEKQLDRIVVNIVRRELTNLSQ